MKSALTIALALGTSACLLEDPTEEATIESLGPELPGVEESEYHRPGQPCLPCHAEDGPYEPALAFGGTVFATPAGEMPVAGASVLLVDAEGNSQTARTNCVGNFLVEADAFEPVYPVSAQIVCNPPEGDAITQPMSSLINRAGACATCHRGQASLESPGWIYCADAMPSPPWVFDESCPGRVPR